MTRRKYLHVNKNWTRSNFYLNQDAELFQIFSFLSIMAGMEPRNFTTEYSVHSWIKLQRMNRTESLLVCCWLLVEYCRSTIGSLSTVKSIVLMIFPIFDLFNTILGYSGFLVNCFMNLLKKYAKAQR